MSEFRRALSAGGRDHPFPAVWVLPTKIAVLRSKQDSSDGVNCLSAELEDLLRSLMTRAAKGGIPAETVSGNYFWRVK